MLRVHKNLEDEPTQLVLGGCFYDQGEYKFRLPTQAIGEDAQSPDPSAVQVAALAQLRSYIAGLGDGPPLSQVRRVRLLNGAWRATPG